METQTKNTTEHMYQLLQEGLIDEHNVRMSYIKAVIAKYKYLGTPIDVKLIDNLADKSVKELEALDVILHGMCTDYARISTELNKKGLDYE